MIITPTVPLYGVIANLLAAPAAPVATIVGLAACLSAPLPWLQSGLTAIAWLPAAWIAGTAHTVSSLPGDQVPWLEGWTGVAALAAVSLAIGAVIAVPRLAATGRVSKPQRVRAAAVLLLAVVAGIVAGSAALSSVAGRLTLPADWSILACDVGQGDAVLVRSARAIALIDTGPDPEQLESCLSRVGVDHIDLLVLTHFDLDHVGGVDAVVGRVGTALHGPPGTPAASSRADTSRRRWRPHAAGAHRYDRDARSVDVAGAVAAGRHARVSARQRSEHRARCPRRWDADIAVPRRSLRLTAGRPGGIRHARAAVRPREGRPSRERRPGRRAVRTGPTRRSPS